VSASAFAQKLKAECAPNAERAQAAMSSLKSVNVARHDKRRLRRSGVAWGGKTIVCGRNPIPIARITESLA
jgi:hypothetical protein